MIRKVSKSLWDTVTYMFQRKHKPGNNHKREWVSQNSGMKSQTRTFFLRTAGPHTSQDILSVYGRMDVSNGNKMSLREPV